MQTVLIGGLVSASLAIVGLMFKEFGRKINSKVNQELCDERSSGIGLQLGRQEEILLRNEQRLIRIEQEIAFLNGRAEGQ